VKQNRVFVLDRDGKPLMPCHPARARQLPRAKRAVAVRRVPFTIRVLDRAGGNTQPVQVKLDPGSKATGLSLVAVFRRRRETVIWAAELSHRGQAIRKKLQDRRMFRRGRRGRKTRYRPPRFLNRRRAEGWLPPSPRHRVLTVNTWVKRLLQWAPVSSLSMELVRFDTQALQNPEINGIEYQRGGIVRL